MKPIINHSHGRIKIAIMTFLFSLPIVIAYCLIFVFNWQINSTFYHGERINPPQSLAIPVLKNLHTQLLDPPFWQKWGLLLLDDNHCQDYICRQRLQILQKLQQKLKSKLNVVLLLKKSAVEKNHLQRLQENYPEITIIRANMAHNQTLFDHLAHLFPQYDKGTYIIDPYKNLMMYYNDGIDNQDIYEDIYYFIRER